MRSDAGNDGQSDTSGLIGDNEDVCDILHAKRQLRSTASTCERDVCRRSMLCLAVCLLLAALCSALLLLSAHGSRQVAGDATSTGGRLRLPNALIIGARKGGTRALLEALAVQPGVLAAGHELHYFDHDDNFDKGLQWYMSQMPAQTSPPSPVVIEKTPGYLTSKAAPGRVYDTLGPNVKLLLIVRDPLTRTVSDYSQVHANKVERNKTHMALGDLAFDRHSGQLAVDYKPVRNSLYAKHIRHWLDVFPIDNFLVIDGDKFIRDPMSEVRRAVSFVGLEASSVHSGQFDYNATKGFYCFRRDLGHSANCLGDTKGRRHVDVDTATLRRMRHAFRIYNQRFFHLMHVQFDW